MHSITSSSSGSKRYDTDGSSASSSLRELARTRQRRQDDLFGFLEDEEQELSTSAPGAASPAVLLPFLAGPPRDFGSELDVFVREMSTPPSIRSFDLDDTKWLKEQLEHFKRKSADLDSFIHSMRA